MVDNAIDRSTGSRNNVTRGSGGPVEITELTRGLPPSLEHDEMPMSNGTVPSRDEERTAHPAREFEMDHVRQAVRGIRFGEVRVIIQDGRIVQIERVEKQRLR
jgi:hypothetical protein